MSKKITVGIDTRDLQIAATGTRIFLEGIIDEFKKPHTGFEFIFFSSSTKAYTGNHFFLKMIEHVRFLSWKQVILPWKAWRSKCDIVFCSDFFVPWVRAGFVTIPVFHDAFFWESPSHYNRQWLWLFKKIGMAAARKAVFIVTPTAYTKKQIALYTNIDSRKIIPVYEAGNLHLNSGHNPQIQNTALQKIKSLHYLLHVGTFEKRKNLPMLIRAFKQLLDEGYTDLKLILAGQASNKTALDDSRTIQHLITMYGLQEQVIMPGYLSDNDVSVCYQHAALYVFPSINEGFGIPVLEAFQYHIPVIVANNTCLPEVAGDAALTFDPFDEKEIAACIRQVLDDPETRKRLIEKGIERSQLFSWQNTGARLLSVFEKAIYSA